MESPCGFRNRNWRIGNRHQSVPLVLNLHTIPQHRGFRLNGADFQPVQTKIRKRGLRWLQRDGHLDNAAVHTLDTAVILSGHAGGWSGDASVTIAQWDRHGLERLGRLNDQTLVYNLRKPTFDGRNPQPALFHASTIHFVLSANPPQHSDV